MEIQILTTQYLSQDCTASLWRCSKNTWRLTSSVKITSEPAATSWAELYVADGFNFARRNRACRISFFKKRLVRQISILRKLWAIQVAQQTQMEGLWTVQIWNAKSFLCLHPHPNKPILFSLQQSRNIVIFYSISLMSSEIWRICHVGSLGDKILVYIHNPYPYPYGFKF